MRHHEIVNVEFDIWGLNSKQGQEKHRDEVPCFLQRRKQRQTSVGHATDSDMEAVGSGRSYVPLQEWTVPSEERPMERLVTLLSQHSSPLSATDNPVRLIQYTIAKLIYQDMGHVMASTGRTLDAIELALSGNAPLQSSMPL